MSDRVLLVEDDEDDEFLLRRALQRAGFTRPVQVARDGAEALRLLDEDCCPRLIVLDLKLPKIDGLDVLRHIRSSQKLKDARVLVLTASNEESDRKTAEELGVVAFVRKPTDTEELDAVARLILQKT